ncbi:MAG: hypothetical protein ACI8ZM_001284 [Crocinitomix sp.]|jgi:hypothetical protein
MNKKHTLLSSALIILTFTFCLSSCGQTTEGKFVYPNGNLRDLKQIDSLYNLSLNVSKSDNYFETALLFRNEYGWQLNKTDQLELDIPEILNKEEYNHEMAYSEIFNPQRSDPSKWVGYIEVCNDLLSNFNKGTSEYREVLAIKSLLTFLTNKNDLALEVLPELLSELTKNSDNYFFMLWQYGMSQSRGGDELAAIITFEKGYEKGVSAPNHSEFAMALMNLYSIHEKYDKIISQKDFILKDTSGNLLYFLGEAYFRSGDNIIALDYFDDFMSHFKETERQPYLIIENGYVINPVRPQHLLVLAEFYSGIYIEKSCKCYSYIQKILSQPKNDLFYQKQLSAIEDTVEKAEFKKNHEEYQNSLDEILKKANVSLKKCN